MEEKCGVASCQNPAGAHGYCRAHSLATPAPSVASEQVRIAAAQAEAAARSKSATAAILLGVFVGYLGADRFYAGQPGLWIAKLLTCGGAGIWWIIDLFLIGGAVEQANAETTREVFARHGL